jgi:acetyl esterase/lipase
MHNKPVHPPFDPEVTGSLAALTQLIPTTFTPDLISAFRVPTDLTQLLEGREVTHREFSVPGFDGGEVILSVFARRDHEGLGPGLYSIHSGGMVIGDRFAGLAEVLGWVEHFDAVCVSVEYRLAPEFPDPYPVEDCYAGLIWVADHADGLGIDRARLFLVGGSAGGGLAAGTSLLARDRKGPSLFGAMLMYPMLDDRDETVSSHQIDGVGFWDRGSNDTGWDALLGERRKTDSVSIYAAPARATDLTELPPTFIDVASAEVFRDEAVRFALQIWADGGVAELHVVPGGFHGFENVAPDSVLAKQVLATRRGWLARMLGRTDR